MCTGLKCTNWKQNFFNETERSRKQSRRILKLIWKKNGLLSWILCPKYIQIFHPGEVPMTPLSFVFATWLVCRVYLYLFCHLIGFHCLGSPSSHKPSVNQMYRYYMYVKTITNCRLSSAWQKWSGSSWFPPTGTKTIPVFSLTVMMIIFWPWINQNKDGLDNVSYKVVVSIQKYLLVIK